MPASEEVQAEVAERRSKAIQLKIAGASLDEIAVALNYGGSSLESRRAAVAKDLQRAFEGAHQAQATSAVEWIELELARLDRIQRGAWPKAMSGDPKAARVVLAVMERRAKYLKLDTTRLEGMFDVPVPVELVDLVEAARERAEVQRRELEAGQRPERE